MQPPFAFLRRRAGGEGNNLIFLKGSLSYNE